jgi:hypothetical protein
MFHNGMGVPIASLSFSNVKACKYWIESWASTRTLLAL